MFIQHLKILSPLLPKVVKIFSQINICHFYTCIQNQIIHKHVHVNYNPLKGLLILISSLKLATFPYAAGPESRGHSRRAWLYSDVKLLPKFHCSLDS